MVCGTDIAYRSDKQAQLFGKKKTLLIFVICDCHEWTVSSKREFHVIFSNFSEPNKTVLIFFLTDVAQVLLGVHWKSVPLAVTLFEFTRVIQCI